jgi:flagellar basal body-associated protein FliL
MIIRIVIGMILAGFMVTAAVMAQEPTNEQCASIQKAIEHAQALSGNAQVQYVWQLMIGLEHRENQLYSEIALKDKEIAELKAKLAAAKRI